MSVRTCPGCGAKHRCADPLYAGKVGNLVAWTEYPERGVGKFTGLSRRGRVIEVHPAEYPVGGGCRTQPDRLVVECDDGIVRVVEDWLFKQNLGTLRLLGARR